PIRVGAVRITAGKPPVRPLEFAQQLALAEARIGGDLPAVVRGARGAMRAGLEMLAKARLDRGAVAERAAVVDQLVVLPQREYAGIGRRARDHGRVERVAGTRDRHACKFTAACMSWIRYKYAAQA